MISTKDKQTIVHLRKDGRITLSKLSRATRTPISTLFNRIKKHEGDTVKRFTVLLNYRKLGYLARAYIVIKVNKKDKQQVRQHLQGHKNVNSLFKVNNGYDYLIDVVCKDYVELEGFIEDLQDQYSVKVGNVHYVIDNIKEERFLSEPNMAEVY